MLSVKNFLFWLTVLCLCNCETQVDQDCLNGCMENVTESTNVPERFDFVARMALLHENSTVENSTQIEVVEVNHDLEIENTLNFFTESDVEEANMVDNNSTQVPVVVRSVEVETENETVSNLNFTESNDVEIRMASVVDYANETMVQTNETSVLMRDFVELENSTEAFNETVVRMARDVDQSELVNTTECENNTITVHDVDGRNFGNECRAVGSCVKGVCDKYSQVFNCVCQPDFEGPTCEIRIVQDKYYEHVMNNTFSLDKFINETFFNSTLGYDELVIHLVDRVWSEINPEEQFVHLFNYYNLTYYANVGLEVQKLLLFSRVSLFEIEDRLNVFEQVLDGLFHVLERSSFKQKAEEFVIKWEDSVNNSKVNNVGRHIVNPVFIESVRSVLNETYYLVRELVDVYEAYLLINETVKFEKMDQLVNSTDRSWVKVIEYGFWHLTSQLVGKEDSYFMGKAAISAKRSLPKA